MGKMLSYKPISHFVEMTGFSARYFTGKAEKGLIPGAIQPGGPGTGWRFEEGAFNEWWFSGRREQWRASTGVEKRGGDVSSVRAVKSDSPLRRRMRELRENA